MFFFDILNRLGVAHKCDRQTRGQTDRTVVSNIMVSRHALKTMEWSKNARVLHL